MRRGRPAVLALALMLLAGCSIGAGVPLSADDVAEYGEIKVRFIKGRDEQVLVVRALDRLSIRQASLVAANGTRTLAYSIETEANPRRGNYANFNAAQGDNAGAPGIAPGQGAAFLPGGYGRVTESFIGQTASVALIRIEDQDQYRRDYDKVRIEVELGGKDDRRVEILKAPAPLAEE